jgi:hypothetical protein
MSNAEKLGNVEDVLSSIRRLVADGKGIPPEQPQDATPVLLKEVDIIEIKPTESAKPQVEHAKASTEPTKRLASFVETMNASIAKITKETQVEETPALDTENRETQHSALTESATEDAREFDEPTQAVEIDEPAEVANVDETTEANETEELVEAADVSEPTKAVEIDEPAEVANVDETTEATKTEEPVEAADVGEPTKAVEIDEPAEVTNVDETTEIEEPATVIPAKPEPFILHSAIASEPEPEITEETTDSPATEDTASIDEDNTSVEPEAGFQVIHDEEAEEITIPEDIEDDEAALARETDATDQPDAHFIDEDALREIVSELVRAELQGDLGDRITRNVRKLVRREIHSALANRELE